MKIKVTQEDIDNGDPGDCDSCPIALALLRHTNAEEVTVGNCNVDIYYAYNRNFGNVRDVEPFEFEMEVG